MAQPRNVIVDADVLRCAFRPKDPNPGKQLKAVRELRALAMNLQDRVYYTPLVKVEFLAHVSGEFRRKAEKFIGECIAIRIYEDDYGKVIGMIDTLRDDAFTNPETGKKETCASGGVVDNLNTMFALRFGFELLGTDKAYRRHRRHFGEKLRLVPLE